MTEPSYPAARLVAEKLQHHFAENREAAIRQGQTVIAPMPDAAVIERVIDAAFWTSLRREEGHPPRISLAFVPPELAEPPLLFHRPLSLSASSLTKVAPGVERPGIHLGVWLVDGELKVWGATRNLPAVCFIVETVAPGLLVVKHRWTEDAAKFINVAVLEGDQIKILDSGFSSLPGCPSVLGSLVGLNLREPASSGNSNVLIRLAVSMREHRRGGSLLVVPHNSEEWRESIGHPMSYSVDPPYSELADVLKEDPAAKLKRAWRDALHRAVEAVAGLTAIDGATVIDSEFHVLAFGAKIIRRQGAVPVERIALTEPTEGAETRIVAPGSLGGTRHLSAAQFTNDQRESLAFIASQDGPFTIFAWAECESRLYGYRVESLLL
jgi:hypothetical protein